MADEKSNNIPAWQQQAQAETDTTATDTTDTSKSNDGSAPEPTEEEATIKQARQFLDDENVRGHSMEKKTEFLKSKGFSAEQIQVLLGETEQTTEAESQETPVLAPASSSSPPQQEASVPASASSPPPQQEAASPTPAESTVATESTANIPPIITYPEFLTTSPKPPPLITPSRLLNILTVSGSVWTLVYGGARYLINPMVNDLSDARSEYYEHVGAKLGEFVERLENVVSEVPYKDKNGKVILKSATTSSEDREDVESTFSDPTELFHRDFGTQTSTPPLESSATTINNGPTEEKKFESSIDKQASRLAAIRAHVAELNEIYTRRSETNAELSAAVRSIRDEVDNLALPPGGAYAYSSDYLGGGGSSSSGSTRGPNGADEEFRRTKDAIRSVKGMFLSTRSFPTVVAR